MTLQPTMRIPYLVDRKLHLHWARISSALVRMDSFSTPVPAGSDSPDYCPNEVCEPPPLSWTPQLARLLDRVLEDRHRNSEGTLRCARARRSSTYCPGYACVPRATRVLLRAPFLRPATGFTDNPGNGAGSGRCSLLSTRAGLHFASVTFAVLRAPPAVVR